MSECCRIPEQESTAALCKPGLPAEAACAACGEVGRSVERKTVLQHVRHDLLDRVTDTNYRFCAAPSCAVVYYGGDGARFVADDLREPVSVKTSGEKRPLCYCFGFTEGDARAEIERAGSSTIPARIGHLIKEGMCACEVRNPAGACCLGEVNRTVKRLLAERGAAASV